MSWRSVLLTRNGGINATGATSPGTGVSQRFSVNTASRRVPVYLRRFLRAADSRYAWRVGSKKPIADSHSHTNRRDHTQPADHTTAPPCRRTYGPRLTGRQFPD